MNNSSLIKKGTELELYIKSLAYGGMGVAKTKDFVIFVKNTIPGQKVLARVYKKKKGYAEAYVKTLLQESSYSKKTRCNHYYICSKLQNLSYKEQLKEKGKQVEDTFQRLGGFTEFYLNRTIEAERIFNYRNKMEFTFSSNRWILENEPNDVDRSFALGLHMTGRYDKILDIKDCHIQPEIGNRILSVARNTCLQNPELKPYNPKSHIGFLRFLMLRFGFNTGDLMVNIVTAYDDIDKLSPLIDNLLKEFPQITSMVNNVNTRKADVSFGEFENLLYGVPYISEKVGKFIFKVSANSFFQTNTDQGEILYNEIEKLINFNGNEIVYDLYCGTGTISIFLSKKAKAVFGFEVIRSALEDAEINAKKNNVVNVKFLKANLDTFFKSGQLPKKTPKPDVIVIDPPRAGVHPDMLKCLPGLKAKKIIYVSCNPTTQSRDAKLLCRKGYKIEESVMVDMFPHTPHIETILLLSNKT